VGSSLKENIIRRDSTVDRLLVIAGLIVAATLLIGGVLAAWGTAVLNDGLRSELTGQRIFFPPAGPETADPRSGPYIAKYAGRQVATGAQAKAYAEYMAVRLEASTGGRTYAELDGASRANPKNRALAEQAQAAFRSETMRGRLLDDYTDARIARIGTYTASGALAAGVGLLLVSGLGFLRLHRPRTQQPNVIGPRMHAEDLAGTRGR
jgi:hypothetical protein